MKHGTAYARRLKRFYGRIKKLECPPELAEPVDPLERLVLAILSLDSSHHQARRALDKLLGCMVDFNEIRVSSPRQIAALIAPFTSESFACATRLCGVLNAVFTALNTVRLDSLRSLGKREARQRLESLHGMEPYSTASVLLWGLGGHAVPVNKKMLEALRREEVVEPSASLAEVQAFLERHISPADAKAFCLNLEHFSNQSPVSKPTARTAAGRASKLAAKAGSSNSRTNRKVAPKR